jgi:hypothetical protein
MKALKVTVIGLLIIALLGFLWLRYQAANERPSPQITPVPPLTLDSVQPLSREAKQQFVEKYEHDFQLVARLLKLSLSEHRVIRVIHARVGDSPHLPRVETEAVRPVLDFVGKYSGVAFQHVAMPAATPPFDQDTLLIRYEVAKAPYKSTGTGIGARGQVVMLEEVQVTLTLLEAKQKGGEDFSVVALLESPNKGTLSYAESLKRQLAERLALPQMSERRYPFDPELEARERALHEWKKKKGAS